MAKKNRIFLLGVIILIGFILRMTVIGKSAYPINDGGLFYRMIIDLQQNHYQIPQFTTYNQGNIPFAYPPLPFYFVGLINTWLKIDLFTLFRILPLVFNLIAIPFVYLLVRKLVDGNEGVALLSTAFWAMLPPSFEWLIMGGGVTRSIAFTFSLMACYFFLEYITTHKFRFLIGGVLAGGINRIIPSGNILGIMLLHSLDLGILCQKPKRYSAPALFLYWLCRFIISVYLFSRLDPMGFSPFYAGFSSGNFSWIKPLKEMILFRLTDEFYLTTVAVLAIFGIYYLVVKKRYFFVVLVLSVT